MGRSLEAYVDDMVIKSKIEPKMIKDVKETLLTLKKVNMKLNPKKCSFRMEDELPALTTLEKEEELMVYLSAANEVVSVVLLVEREGREEQETTATKAPENLKAKAEVWKLYTDGASNKHGFEAGLRIATKIKVEKMHAFVDLKLVANQVEGPYEAKGEKTKKYKEKVLEIIQSFSNFQISHMPREENRKADALSKLAVEQCEGLTNGAKYLLKEIYMGSCKMHDKPMRAVHKAMNAEYFWPSMHRDANNETSSCDSCQVFGIPATIITDNRTQLMNEPFKSWAEGLGIKLVSTSKYHPQANGAVERANRSIMQGIKTRLHQEEEHG
uniref:Integrase catalytic domain-containing protein n=1 Tax=Tanacetum cinerariifolium TaxID=118510 RepID=A0A6L2N8L9_TANCI|nr:hypothetical protein [Tanacetum cinerariifolium]